MNSFFVVCNYNSNYNEAPTLLKVCRRTTNSLGNFSLAAKTLSKEGVKINSSYSGLGPLTSGLGPVKAKP